MTMNSHPGYHDHEFSLCIPLSYKSHNGNDRRVILKLHILRSSRIWRKLKRFHLSFNPHIISLYFPLVLIPSFQSITLVGRGGEGAALSKPCNYLLKYLTIIKDTHVVYRTTNTVSCLNGNSTPCRGFLCKD